MVDIGKQLIPIEVKLSTTPRPAMANNIKIFRKNLGHKAAPGYVVHPRDILLPFAPEVTALPFAQIERAYSGRRR